VALSDPHAGPDGRYHIRSLYFDNADDKALREKIDGEPRREKFRIRMYNMNPASVHLEKKSKQDSLGDKQSAPLTQTQCRQILTGDIGWMRESPHALIRELYGKMQGCLLRPKTVVDYWREPYVYPPGNVRVTFDMDIRTGLYSIDYLNPDLPTIPVGTPDILLMEVKYDHFLPDIVRDAIQTGRRSAASYSKYAACRIYG
jgi:hypothetical protein